MSTLAEFQVLRDLAHQMLEAARANDWDRLQSLEHEQAERRRALGAGISTEFAATMTAEERASLEGIIREAEGIHEQIREIVGPWLESVRGLLSTQTRERSVRQSYGAFAQDH